MTLQPGTQLGPYEILSPLGAGGMGEVYQARDAKLGRDVALKVLPPGFASDPDRMARFTREAQLLASLNHQNIAAIYGVEESGPHRALILEYVDGETLEARIARGPIPIDDALQIALQIAQALEAAHEKSLIHRDLKPANIKITSQGLVKVLDFGLAKAIEPASGLAASSVQTGLLDDSPTLSAAMTSAGIILGTAGYMAPEQARGKAVDQRADIWAFGVVLFEMLRGKRAFAGETVTDTLAKVLERDPDWQQLPPHMPPALRQLLRRALNKDPKNRLQAIGDARITLQELIAAPAARDVDVAATLTSASPRWRKALPWVLAPAFLVVGLVVGLWMRQAGEPTEYAGSQFEYPLPSGQVLSHNYRHGAEISPDGKRIAFAANSLGGVATFAPPAGNMIFIRNVNQWDAVPVPGSEGGINPFFSPDGQSLGFRSGTELKKVLLSGGTPTLLLENVGTLNGYTWGKNGMIVFGGGFSEGLKVIRDSGGEPESFTELDAPAHEVSHRLPHFLPDGSAVLFTVVRYTTITPDWSRAEVWVKSLKTGMRTRVLENATDARYAGNRILTFARQGRLFAVRFDPDSLSVQGTATVAVDGVAHALYGHAGLMWTGAAQYSVAENGTLLYAPGSIEPPYLTSLSWVDRQGKPTPLPARPGSYYGARVSADGKRIAYSEYHQVKDIWLFDTVRGTTDRQTWDGQNMFPIWAPDDSRFAFRSDRAGPLGVHVTQGLNSRLVTGLTAGPLDTPSSWTPDGKELVFGRGFPLGGGANSDIYVVSADGSGQARPLLNTASNERFPEFSPDGKWLAFCSDETGRFELYVQPYPGPGTRVTLTSEGAAEPAWSRDGNELFYRSGQRMMSVRFTISRSGEFVPEKPVELFVLPTFGGGADVRAQYDTAPGGRFLIIQAIPGQDVERNTKIFPPSLRISLTWSAAIRRAFDAAVNSN